MKMNLKVSVLIALVLHALLFVALSTQVFQFWRSAPVAPVPRLEISLAPLPQDDATPEITPPSIKKIVAPAHPSPAPEAVKPEPPRPEPVVAAAPPRPETPPAKPVPLPIKTEPVNKPS